MPLAISLVALSSVTDAAAVAAGIRGLESLDVRVHCPEPLQRPTRYLAGERQWRLDQLHAAYADPDTRAVWAIRGGYGAAQLLDGIDWAHLKAHPKPLVGFSDVTVLLDHWRRQGLTAIHGPVVKAAGQLLDGDAQARALVRRQLEETLALIGGTCEQRLPITGWGDAPARLTGTVVGGNLITLASLAGTPAAFRAPPGALVVLEDVGEPYYRLERALWQLVHGGALDAAAAVCLGTFEGCSAFDETPLEAIVTETLAPLGVPLYHGLPVGHGLHNRPWRVGAPGLIEGGELIMAGRRGPCRHGPGS